MNQAKVLNRIIVNLASSGNSRVHVRVPITEETTGETIIAEAFIADAATGTQIQTEVITGGSVGESKRIQIDVQSLSQGKYYVKFYTVETGILAKAPLLVI